MKLNNIKPGKNKIPQGKGLLKKMIAALVSVAVFAVSFVIITKANEAATNTVAVLQVRAAGGIPERAVITKDNIVKYDIIRREYREDMVLAEDMDKVIEKFTTCYLRNGSVLYKDEITDEQPLKNEWLYQMDDDQEALTIPYKYGEGGGNILTPGDRIRVRVTYKEDPSSSYDPYSFYGESDSESTTSTEILFDSIEVVDMINSKGNSIYELYKEILRLPEDQRQKVLKSKEFISSIVPSALILAANPDQVNNYIQYKEASGNKILLITILQRDENQIILDQLPTIEMEISNWLDGQ